MHYKNFSIFSSSTLFDLILWKTYKSCPDCGIFVQWYWSWILSRCTNFAIPVSHSSNTFSTKEGIEIDTIISGYLDTFETGCAVVLSFVNLPIWSICKLNYKTLVDLLLGNVIHLLLGAFWCLSLDEEIQLEHELQLLLCILAYKFQMEKGPIQLDLNEAKNMKMYSIVFRRGKVKYLPWLIHSL